MPRNPVKRLSTLASVVVISTLTTACSGTTTGLPLPVRSAPLTPGPSGSFSETPEPPSSSPDVIPPSPLKDVEQCSLLTSTEINDLHAGTPTSERLGNARACDFEGGKDFVIGFAIFDEAGLTEILSDGPPTPVPLVGKHKAVWNMRGGGTCAVSIEVTKTSRVDSQGTDDNGNKQRGCDLAMNLARLVEPKLP